MKKILCILGKSCAGKDTTVEYFMKTLKRKKLKNKVKKAISATTRPPRKNEKNGKEYHFITEEDFSAIRNSDGFIEETYYEVNGEIWRYGFTKEEFLEDKTYVVIINPRGLEAFLKSDLAPFIIPIYLICDDEIRKERYLKRDPGNPNIVKQWNARYEQDKIDFENIFNLLSLSKPYYVVDSVDDNLAEISDLLLGLL